jgi:hypothetical protein
VLPNPATGDTEKRHRPTLERCISRSRAAGHTGQVIVNLFAFRDTNPRNFRTAPDAVGPANDEVLRVIAKAAPRRSQRGAGTADCKGRSGQVGPLLDSPMCVAPPSAANPRHSLYVTGDTELQIQWLLPSRPLLPR